MSDVELDREDEIHVPENDHAHQTCYVFEPFLSDDLEQEKPAKKRRKTKQSLEDDTLPFPLLNHGEESRENAQLRYEKCQQTWSRLEKRIELKVNTAEEGSLAEVARFVHLPRQDQARQKLQVGLLVSGPDGGAQTRVLERWKSHQGKASSQVVVQLRASHCTNLQTMLRSVIKNTISSIVGQDGYQAFLTRHKRLIPMPFDLELLQNFVEERGIEKIVISILDVETFDIIILSDLFVSLASWSSKIPFVALLGIATTVKLFESRLSKSTIEILEATMINLQSSGDLLQQILDDIQKDEVQHIKFGPTTLSALEELTQNQGITVEAFTSAIKYAVMSHFFSNSLSVLASPSKEIQADNSLCVAIRNTPSFQQYCETLLDKKPTAAEKTKISDLLTNDKTLLAASIDAANIQNANEQAFSLEEAYFLNSRQVLHPFTARPRYALERALSRPVDYLGCECCQPTNKSSSTQSAPPTTILYTLLQEAGTVINVRDLYDAFCSRCFNTGSSHEDTVGPNDKADRKQLSTFYVALAELKMLGLVKSSTSTLIKKRAMASMGVDRNDDSSVLIKGRDRYGDVDFIAKTGWAGL